MALGKRVLKIHSVSHFAMILSKSIMIHPTIHPSIRNLPRAPLGNFWYRSIPVYSYKIMI